MSKKNQITLFDKSFLDDLKEIINEYRRKFGFDDVDFQMDISIIKVFNKQVKRLLRSNEILIFGGIIIHDICIIQHALEEKYTPEGLFKAWISNPGFRKIIFSPARNVTIFCKTIEDYTIIYACFYNIHTEAEKPTESN